MSDRLEAAASFFGQTNEEWAKVPRWMQLRGIHGSFYSRYTCPGSGIGLTTGTYQLSWVRCWHDWGGDDPTAWFWSK